MYPSLPIPTPSASRGPEGRWESSSLPHGQNMEHPQPSWVFHSLSGEATTYKRDLDLPALLGQTNH